MPRVTNNGFPCNACGERMTVTQTKTDALGRLVRYRKCLCGFKITTREMAISIGNTSVKVFIQDFMKSHSPDIQPKG